MCLSCHDGTVAIDSFANAGILRSGQYTMKSIGANTNVIGDGGSLTSDHPISFTYNGALADADGHLNRPASVNYADSSSLLPLYAGQLECATCHAVHDNTYPKFLRISNGNSAMCRTCHTQ